MRFWFPFRFRRRRRWATRRLAVVVVVVVAFTFTFVSTSCEKETGELTVDIPAAPTAAQQFLHGNCFAGWSIAVELRVRETRGVELVMDGLATASSTRGLMEELGADTLDRAPPPSGACP